MLLRILAAVFLALCLTPVYLVWNSEPARQVSVRRDPPPSLRWLPGTRQCYRVETAAVARFHLPGSARPLPMEARLDGFLELLVEEADEVGVRVRFRLDRGSYATSGMPDRAEELGLSTPFDVVLRADGLPLEFGIPLELPDEARTVLEQLVRTFQVVVAPGAGDAWSAREENGTGRYLADYRVAPDGTLVKAKTAFETVNAQTTGALGPLDVRILRSRALVRLDPGASWVEAVQLEEEARFLANDSVVLESTLTATLTRTAGQPTAEDVARERRSAPREIPSPEEAAPGHTPPSPTVDAAAELARLLGDLERSGGTSTASVHGIRDLVARYPEVAEQVCAALAEGTLGDRSAAALIHALQLAGTPAAQTALGSILVDERFGRANRLRAAIALGGLERPTGAALEPLWSATSLRHSDEAEELADTALLALGALAPADRGASGESVGPVEARLVARLATAGDEDERGILLGALGNSKNTALAPTVAPYLDCESAYVRSSAADALGNMPCPAVEQALTTRLGQERSAHVRTALAAALNRMPDPTRSSLVLVESLIRAEDSDSACLEMAKFLGKNIDTFPAARQTLEDLLLTSRSPRVRSSAAEALLRP